jgi:hypothetical protein
VFARLLGVRTAIIGQAAGLLLHNWKPILNAIGIERISSSLKARGFHVPAFDNDTAR